MKNFFLYAGAVIVCMGLAALVRPLAFTGAPNRRPGLGLVAAGLLIILGATFPPPDAVAAADTRGRLTAALSEQQPARQEVVARWEAALEALPGGKVPARFLRWNTTDPLFGTNLNLLPAAAHTEELTPAEIIARSTSVPLVQVQENPTKHIGSILKYQGTVMYATAMPLDSLISQVLQRSDTALGLVWVQVSGGQRFQFLRLGGAEELTPGERVTAYGYLLGLVDSENRTPVLLGKVMERK